MAKNQFSPLDKLPNEEDLKYMVGNFEYRRLDNHELPAPITSNGLVEKCNSFIRAASGSSVGMLYNFVGLRPDKGGVIDENPFVLYYDYNDPSKNFGGIIHHGNWPDRTYPLESWQLAAISGSSMAGSFTYKSVPSGSSG
ncbi:MAG: hypothetical protein WBP58_17775 [Chitinophagaceae bacterium]